MSNPLTTGQADMTFDRDAQRARLARLNDQRLAADPFACVLPLDITDVPEADITDVHGDLTTVEMQPNLAYGGYNVVLTNDAQTTKRSPAWLVPSAARALIAHLEAGIAQAEAKNLAEYGDTDGPQKRTAACGSDRPHASHLGHDGSGPRFCGGLS